MRQHVRLLRVAREILACDGAWTKGAFARKSDGQPIDPFHPNACSFCALGALDRASKLTGLYGVRSQASRALDETIGPRSRYYRVVWFNDYSTRTQAQVVALFDKAIAREARCS